MSSINLPNGQSILQVDPKGIELLTEKAMIGNKIINKYLNFLDIAHLLRPGHLQQL